LKFIDEKTQKKSNNFLVANNIKSNSVINVLMDMDEENKSTKSFPIMNCNLDLRYMLLVPKIEKVIGRHNSLDSNLGIQDFKGKGMSEF
jgi:hypothetical protein